MGLIHRYILSETCKSFMLVLISISMIFLIIDFIERIDNFMETELPFSRFIEYMLLKVPFILGQILPICVLLAVLITFGIMIKNNEIMSIKGSGISIYYLLQPVLIFGIASTAAMFLLSEIIIPQTADRANYIWYKEIKNRNAQVSKEKNIWIKGDGLIANIAFFHQGKQIAHGITLYFFDNNFRLIQRIDAKKGHYENDQWILESPVHQLLEKTGETQKVSYPEILAMKLVFKPSDLIRVSKKSEEMSYLELKAYIEKIRREGYDATMYQVDLYAKTAFPFICLIMTIIGAGTALKQSKIRGLAQPIVFGVVAAFFYWMMNSISISLGHAGQLPSILSAWSTNILFSCYGFLSLLNAEGVH
ncbi:MAG: permease YjgP/YjgQ family protein [Candidatus Magnetoglobus multicellularis str. Araruama]|uniref:Permease YjgP/YjgQ family protein n=1 Tax=Candidatus Magnetoglobus multicellularis str. Araruama TaxID=890399 RepID=A0A1V1P8J6_9BACT|nr:MAG: permease YjgP/YjgQ family protein [Candidatus Magnetoglobus multicellularis str. Araruama]